MIKEEEEEKRMEIEILEFKSRKKTNKMKPEEETSTICEQSFKKLRMEEQDSSHEVENQVHEIDQGVVEQRVEKYRGGHTQSKWANDFCSA